jgi:hypothetical protein
MKYDFCQSQLKGAQMRCSILQIALLVFFLIGNSITAYAQAQPTANEQVTAVLQQIKNHVTLKLSPTTVQNAIDAADYEVLKISDITIAASISEDAANVMLPLCTQLVGEVWPKTREQRCPLQLRLAEICAVIPTEPITGIE